MVLLIHTVAYFSPLRNLDLPFFVQIWSPKSKCEVLGSEPLPLPSLLPSPPRKRAGRKQRGPLEAVRGGVWLTAAQSGGSGRLGADWEEKGLPPLPSPACCPSWSPRAPWLTSPFSSLHLLDGCPLVTRGSLPVWIWAVSSLGPSWGNLCQIPKPLPSFP